MLKRFSITGLALLLLIGISAVALKPKAKPAQTQDSTVIVYNNMNDGRWVNVPIEITSLGGYNYRVTNVSGMGIKRFIIALYAGYIGIPRHGEGARRHSVLVRIMDKPTIAPGKSIDLNIEDQLKEFNTKWHEPVDMSLIEMWPYIIEFSDEYTPTKRWFGGKYLRATESGNWEEDPDLNPKQNSN